MNEPILYIIGGATASAILRQVYRKAFDGTAGHVDALAAENRKLTDTVTLLTKENEELRTQLANQGGEYAEPEYQSRVRDLISQHKLIEAIKEYRAATGVDLKTAKEFVEALSRHTQSAAQSRTQSPQIDRVTALVMSGNKIAAIRDYREATGVSLVEAKEYVEGIERQFAK
jgi:ribosomal protein L7/L12